MKQKKAELSLTVIAAIILTIAGLFFASGFITDVGNTGRNLVDSFMDSNFNFLLLERVTNDDLLEEPLPDAFEEYEDQFIKDVFGSGQPVESGQIIFVEPFFEGMVNYKEYDDYAIHLSASDIFGNGVLVRTYHGKLNKIVPTNFTPDKKPFLRERELCLLPGYEDSSQVNSVLAYYMWGPEKKTSLTPQQIISRGKVDSLVVSVDKKGMRIIPNEKGHLGDGKSHIIFKYEKDETKPVKIPVYLYKNTVCFFAVQESGSGVAIKQRNRNTEIVGDGPLYWETLKQIQNEYLEYDGDTQ